ncbi:MAG: CPBP family intramembrane metalloprotease [Oscillospiraceae bacterium]|nr:CPBP family intramembrane metalloprotease [Oscillospiraceae bacterium]
MDEMQERDCNITLDFHSKSAKNGHFGSSTDYIAAEHRVVRRTWGARRRFYDLLPPKMLPTTIEYMDIPEEITSEREIRAYLRSHRGQWTLLSREVPVIPRKKISWSVFAAVLCACSLWLLFVIDYWNNATAYISSFPWHLHAYTQYTNASYLISAGLPLTTFFLLCVLPDAMGRMFSKYNRWNKWYIAIAAILLTVQTALMLASSRFYVETGIAELLFGYHYHITLRKMTEWYIRSIPVVLGLSVLVWLFGILASLHRMNRPVRHDTCKQTVETGIWCVVLTVILSLGSIMILNLLAAMNHSGAAANVTAFASHIARNRKETMISLISAPLVEEIAFRGVICKWLKKTSNSWIAVVISAVFFGLWHRNLGQFSYTFVWGTLFGFICLRSGTVIWPVMMHFFSNLLSVLAHSNSNACILGAWPAFVGIRVWIQQWSIPATILGLVFMVAVTLCICIRISRITK